MGSDCIIPDHCLSFYFPDCSKGVTINPTISPSNVIQILLGSFRVHSKLMMLA